MRYLVALWLVLLVSVAHATSTGFIIGDYGVNNADELEVASLITRW
jgi:hypothetical protein